MTNYIPKMGGTIKFGDVTYKKINKMSKLTRFPKSSSKKKTCQVCGINETTNRCNRNFSHNQPHLCKLEPKGYCRKKNLRDKIKLESIVEDVEEYDEWFPEDSRKAGLKRLWDEHVQKEEAEEQRRKPSLQQMKKEADFWEGGPGVYNPGRHRVRKALLFPGFASIGGGGGENLNIWWNQNKVGPVNLGNNRVAKIRNKISIILQSDPYLKAIALEMNRAIINIILQMANILSIDNQILVDKINQGMDKRYPGAFLFDKRYFNFNNLHILNFRELMHLFNTFWNCSVIKEPLLMYLLLNLDEKNLINSDLSRYPELKEFISKYKILYILVKVPKLSYKKPFCTSYDPFKSRDDFSIESFIDKSDQKPLTVTYKNMIDLGMPLSNREKQLTNYKNDTDNINWYSGASFASATSGEIIDMATRDDYDLLTGISGSSWKYYMMLCCLNVDIDQCKWAIISFLNGCFHHSIFECTLTSIHFNDFLKIPEVAAKGFCMMNIDETFNNYITHVLSDLVPFLNAHTVQRITSELTTNPVEGIDMTSEREAYEECSEEDSEEDSGWD